MPSTLLSATYPFVPKRQCGATHLRVNHGGGNLSRSLRAADDGSREPQHGDLGPYSDPERLLHLLPELNPRHDYVFE
jgi:hypothetical protein